MNLSFQLYTFKVVVVGLSLIVLLWDIDMPLVGVFLSDPIPYLSDFPRIPHKTPNGKVNERDRESNPAPPVYRI